MKIDYTKKGAHILKTTKSLIDDLLEKNENNRNIKKGHLAWIKKSIAQDKFILTGQGIATSNKGALIDGQHRLQALREAGYPEVEILLVTGLEEKAKIYVDQHAKRSTTDMLKIVMNHNISARMAGALNFHLKLSENKDTGFSFAKDKPDLEEVIIQMQKHEKFLSQVVDAAGENARAGILAGLFHFGIKHDKDDALEFAESVKDGERLVKTDPAYKLRGYILGKIGRRYSYGSVGMLEDYKHTVSCCCAYAQGRKMEALRPAQSWSGLPK